MSDQKRTRRPAAAVSLAELLPLKLPVAAPDEVSYVATESGHIDVRLEGAALVGFRRYHAGLIASHAADERGRPVASKGEALRHLFAQLAPEESDAGRGGSV